MPNFTKTYIVASVRFPDDTYASVDDFWSKNLNKEAGESVLSQVLWAAQTNGSLVESTSTLNEDNKTLSLSQAWEDEAAYNLFVSQTSTERDTEEAYITLTED